MGLQLNCDMGEGFGIYTMGLDEHIMPYIDMANLACGFHAGDPLTMSKSVALAAKHGVAIGAHPAYPDLVGFGRRDMQCSAEEIEAMFICGQTTDIPLDRMYVFAEKGNIAIDGQQLQSGNSVLLPISEVPPAPAEGSEEQPVAPPAPKEGPRGRRVGSPVLP